MYLFSTGGINLMEWLIVIAVILLVVFKFGGC
ncbi:MAG: twin-arginine translocase TatA/TatE family subunit [Deltaproteobacteria bacterium]|nr:twin-arginine translocase TatA/TatE family subunit [Deltaproteobacteria bacterium]